MNFLAAYLDFIVNGYASAWWILIIVFFIIFAFGSSDKNTDFEEAMSVSLFSTFLLAIFPFILPFVLIMMVPGVLLFYLHKYIQKYSNK